MEKKKVMISIPMAGRTEDEIQNEMTKIAEMLEELGYEVVDTFFKNEWEETKAELSKNKPVYFLAKSIEALSKCDAIYMAYGWEKARGCRVEHKVAYLYGLNILYGNKNDNSVVFNSKTKPEEKINGAKRCCE